MSVSPAKVNAAAPVRPEFRPIAVANLSQAVADQIVEAIGGRRLLPGQRILEVELSRELSVSRVPVREALLVLQSQGILHASPRRGTHVIELDQAWAREVYETRTALETRCFQRAADVLRQRPDAVATLDGHIEQIRQACGARDKPAINRADLAFHDAVYEIAGSPLLRTLWNAMSRHVMIMFGLETYRHSDFQRIIDEHVELREVLLHGGLRDIESAVARHVIGPFDSETIARTAYEAAEEPR